MEREVDRNIEEPSQQLSSSSSSDYRMAPGQPKSTLAKIATGNQSQYSFDAEKSDKKPLTKRRQNKSSKNRNKRKAKKEEKVYRKSMGQWAASANAMALIDPNRISHQENHFEPFSVGSTHLRSAIQWQAGQRIFNSQCTGDTECVSQAGSFGSPCSDHPYHPYSTTSYNSQNISTVAGRISRGAQANSMHQGEISDHCALQSHGICFGGQSDSTSSLPSETYSGYQGALQNHPYSPPYQASQYCHPAVWQDLSQTIHPPETSFEHGNRIPEPCTRYFPCSTYANNPPIPLYRPTADCPPFTPNMPFNKENSTQVVRDNSIAPNLLREGTSKAERTRSEEETRRAGGALDSVEDRRQAPQLCTGPIFSHGNYSIPRDFGEELEPASVYILEAFRSGEYADFRLILNSSTENCPPVFFCLHWLIASRSPYLKELMKAMDAATYPKDIRVIAAGSFSHPFALGMALQHFYGVPLLDEERLHNDLTPAIEISKADDRDQHCGESFREVEKMNFILCYIASAAFLAESKILRRGIRLATSAICWDNLEAVVHFGISASDFMIVPAGSLGIDWKSASSATLCPKAASLSKSKEQVLENGLVRRDNPQKCSYALNWELKDVWAPQLLHEAIGFIVRSFPQNFQFDPDAHSRVLSDRLSGQLPSRFNIKEAAAVTFGSFSTTENYTFRRDDRIMSTIFLEVPFKILEKLFNILKVRGLLSMSIAEDIIFERERRRIRAVRTIKRRYDNTATSSAPELTLSEPDPIGWREEIITIAGSLDSSLSIIKTWVGLDVPGIIEMKPKETSRKTPCSGLFGV